MTTQDIEKKLISLEREYWEAMRDGNASAARRLTDDPCLVAGAQGVMSLSADQLTKMISHRKYELKSFELTDAQVRVLTDDVAVLAYKIHEEMIVDGKPTSIDAADASTWIRRDEKWVCAMHTESIAGDPFGRKSAQ